MTGLSRSPRATVPGSAPGRSFCRKHLIRCRWIALCIPLGGGCFYVEPTWTPEVNRPPVLIEPRGVTNVLVFDNDTERITAIASDPDGDNLLFIWSVPPFVTAQEFTTPGDAVTWGRLDLQWHPDLDGAEIGLVIVDDYFEDPRAISVTWSVVSP